MICPLCNNRGFPWAHSCLAAGDRIEIYIKGEEAFIATGMATLIKESKSWRVPEPYPLVLHCKKCKKQVNVQDQRWIVEYDDGFRTARWIPVITKNGTIHVKDELDISDNEPEEGMVDPIF